jgi:hypothetical protein
MSGQCRNIDKSISHQSNNKMRNEQKSQLDKANDALKALRLNVTTTDRIECGFAESTVIQYLYGNGKNLDTAMKMLSFFRKRIEEREKAIA